MIHLLVINSNNRNNNDSDNKSLHRTNNNIKYKMNDIETNDNSNNIQVGKILSRKLNEENKITPIDNNKIDWCTQWLMQNTTYETINEGYTYLQKTNTDYMTVNTNHTYEGNIPNNDIQKCMG